MMDLDDCYKKYNPNLEEGQFEQLVFLYKLILKEQTGAIFCKRLNSHPEIFGIGGAMLFPSRGKHRFYAFVGPYK